MWLDHRKEWEDEDMVVSCLHGGSHTRRGDVFRSVRKLTTPYRGKIQTHTRRTNPR